MQIIILGLAIFGGYALYKSYVERGLIGPTLTPEGQIRNLPQLPGKSETTRLQLSAEGNLQIQMKPQVIKKDGQPIATYIPSPITLDLNKLASNVKSIFK